MVATVVVKRMTGAGPTYTTVTAVRLRTDDANTADTTNPIPIHASGVGNFKYSYWASICLDLSGSFTQIDNIRHYTDGTCGWNDGTGGVVNRGDRDSGDHGCPDGSYQQAAGTPGDTGYAIDDGTNGHAYYKTAPNGVADIFSDISGSPATIDSSTYGSPTKTKHLVVQAKVDGDATQGTQSAETFTWIYDEI